MTRREFQNLGSGSGTATRFRTGKQLRREFRPLPGGVANAPCEKVNFKVFDFATGDLLWQKRTYSPMVATDGDVWDRYYTEYSGGYAGGLVTFDATFSLPDRSATPGPFYTLSYIRYDGTDGTALNTPALFSAIAGSDPRDSFPTTTLEMNPSSYRVNGSGHMADNYTSTTYQMFVVDPSTTATELTYIANRMPFKSTTNLVLTMNSTGSPSAYSAATIGVTDSTATIESTIATAFGSNVTTVTATGDTLATGPVKIVIDWASNLHYLDTFKVEYASGIISSSRDGNAFLYNLLTGYSLSYGATGGYSSSYQGRSCWQSDGNLFRKGADPSNASKIRVESWDTSTTPWTLDWSELPLDGKTAIDSDLTMSLLTIISAGGICGISFPYTADDSDLLVNRMSVMTWNDDGTGQETYHNSGNNFTGYLPNSFSVEDGGTDLVCMSKDWRDKNVQVVHGDSFTQSVYASRTGETAVTFTSGSGYSVTNKLCIGDYGDVAYGLQLPGSSLLGSGNIGGFDSSRIAFTYTGVNAASATGVVSDYASDLVETWAAVENSGILNDSLVEIQRNRLHYRLLSAVGSLEDADTEWRIRWKLNPGSTEETTSWFSQTDNLAALNAELLSMFGVDANAEQNVIASIGAASPASPVTVPLYKQEIFIEAISARTIGDATTMATPAFFITPGSTAITARSRQPFMYLDVQSLGKAQTYTLGAVNVSDGSFAWARNWRLTGSPQQIYKSMLHDGQLHVLGFLSCIETYAGLTAEAEETTTPPYAPTGGTATFDITFRNLSGVSLSSLTLNASHDGGGSLSSPTMPTSLAVGASATVSLTYTTSSDLANVTLTVYVTGTKPDTTTIDSNALLLAVVVDPEVVDSEDPPPP